MQQKTEVKGKSLFGLAKMEVQGELTAKKEGLLDPVITILATAS